MLSKKEVRRLRKSKEETDYLRLAEHYISKENPNEAANILKPISERYTEKSDEARANIISRQSGNGHFDLMQDYGFASNQGYQEIFHNLGDLFYRQRKYVTALKYLEQASSLGSGAAFYTMGSLYSQDRKGISKKESPKRSSAEALVCYRKAAVEPYHLADAQYALGKEYETGNLQAAIKQDMLQALEGYL